MDFNGIPVQVTDFTDITAEERVIEFHAQLHPGPKTAIAVVVPWEKGWQDAKISVDPSGGELSAAFVLWALNAARDKLS